MAGWSSTLMPRWAAPSARADLAFRMAPFAKAGFGLVLALGVADCSSTTASRGRSSDNKYGVAASPKVIPDGEPIPKGGGREMVGKPYVVGGRTYVPTPGKGYSREGWASWYGTAFHGRLTANGEVFDRESVAAASPTLPLPCYVRVTNLVNKRSMIVRVNDRGPYEQDRLIDLSERAADALGFHRRGTSRVRVEYVGRASVKGSDDAKLLATLRTDGAPAPFGHPRGPVMFADLRDDAPPSPALPPRAAPVRLADATPSPAAALEAGDEDGGPVFLSDAEPAVPTVPRPSMAAPRSAPPVERMVAPTPPERRVAIAAPIAAPALRGPLAAPPIDLLPPQRPVLAGIY